MHEDRRQAPQGPETQQAERGISARESSLNEVERHAVHILGTMRIDLSQEVARLKQVFAEIRKKVSTLD